MQDIKFTRANGNIPAIAVGSDHVSGFLMYCPDYPVADSTVQGFSDTNNIMAVSSIELAEKLGITADAPQWTTRALYYHLSEIYRLNPSISLYVGVYKLAENSTFREVKAMQNYAGGDLRQVAVYNPTKELNAEDVTTLQGVASTLEGEDMPLSILYAATVRSAAELRDLSGIGKKNVSVVISQAGNGAAANLYKDVDNSDVYSVTTIGNCLGILSSAKVNESIAWVQKYPSGIDLPALCDGTLIRDLDKAVIESLDTKHYLFLTTYSGLTGSFYNDNYTLDQGISDYAYIDRVRVMDKAVRGIRTYVLPLLGGNIFIDPTTGQLATLSISTLISAAQIPLDEMETKGEISGLKVEIDPNQNVLATSCVNFVIKQVPTGIMRHVKVNIGFTNKI